MSSVVLLYVDDSLCVDDGLLKAAGSPRAHGLLRQLRSRPRDDVETRRSIEGQRTGLSRGESMRGGESAAAGWNRRDDRAKRKAQIEGRRGVEGGGRRYVPGQQMGMWSRQ